MKRKCQAFKNSAKNRKKGDFPDLFSKAVSEPYTFAYGFSTKIPSLSVGIQNQWFSFSGRDLLAVRSFYHFVPVDHIPKCGNVNQVVCFGIQIIASSHTFQSMTGVLDIRKSSMDFWLGEEQHKLFLVSTQSQAPHLDRIESRQLYWMFSLRASKEPILAS